MQSNANHCATDHQVNAGGGVLLNPRLVEEVAEPGLDGTVFGVQCTT